MILTARDLAAEPEGKREPVEILLVVNILQTLYTQALTVRKMGLAFAIMNWGFGCVSKPSACLLLLALRSHRSHQYLPNETLAHKTPNPAALHLEEEQAQMLTPMQIHGHTAFCQEAHTECQEHCTSSGLPMPVKMLVAGSIWQRRPQGCQRPPGPWGQRSTWRIPAPAPSQWVAVLAATTVPRLWSTGEVDVTSYEAAKRV